MFTWPSSQKCIGKATARRPGTLARSIQDCASTVSFTRRVSRKLSYCGNGQQWCMIVVALHSFPDLCNITRKLGCVLFALLVGPAMLDEHQDQSHALALHRRTGRCPKSPATQSAC
eukprot:3175831-Amphidinium_carterae.1